MAMPSPVTVPRYTIQDLESFPDDGNRYELLDGVLLVTPQPAPSHQIVVARLVKILSVYLEEAGRAEVVSPGGVEVEPNVHLEPDLLVVPVEALRPALVGEGRWTSIKQWWLAVEVSGPESRIYDRDHKRPAYLSLGVREVWRIDLREKRAYVSRAGEVGETQVDDRLTWLPPGMAEPLVIEVPRLFALP